MSTNRKMIRTALVVCAALLMALLIGAIRYKTVLKTFWEGPHAGLPSAVSSESPWGHFLDDNFKIVTNVSRLPGPVQQALLEKEGGFRPFMANPKERFLTGDVIEDPTLPRTRLIFAGVTDDKCFVHFERGGRGRSYFVDFFGTMPDGKMKFLGTGSCPGPARNVQDLRHCLVGVSW